MILVWQASLYSNQISNMSEVDGNHAPSVIELCVVDEIEVWLNIFLSLFTDNCITSLKTVNIEVI